MDGQTGDPLVGQQEDEDDATLNQLMAETFGPKTFATDGNAGE